VGFFNPLLITVFRQLEDVHPEGISYTPGVPGLFSVKKTLPLASTATPCGVDRPLASVLCAPLKTAVCACAMPSQNAIPRKRSRVRRAAAPIAAAKLPELETVEEEIAEDARPLRPNHLLQVIPFSMVAVTVFRAAGRAGATAALGLVLAVPIDSSFGSRSTSQRPLRFMLFVADKKQTSKKPVMY
jgi:hypothetical protein